MLGSLWDWRPNRGARDSRTGASRRTRRRADGRRRGHLRHVRSTRCRCVDPTTPLTRQCSRFRTDSQTMTSAADEITGHIGRSRIAHHRYAGRQFHAFDVIPGEHIPLQVDAAPREREHGGLWAAVDRRRKPLADRARRQRPVGHSSRSPRTAPRSERSPNPGSSGRAEGRENLPRARLS